MDAVETIEVYETDPNDNPGSMISDVQLEVPNYRVHETIEEGKKREKIAREKEIVATAAREKTRETHREIVIGLEKELVEFEKIYEEKQKDAYEKVPNRWHNRMKEAFKKIHSSGYTTREGWRIQLEI